ncbi:MAG: hypothetical protein ACOX0H_00265 [Patescibacteria group bacterium]|jgi:hypothetical protein|nr:hypothetical protein [bacterium]HQC50096.1 hypothetical protein [bacterium]
MNNKQKITILVLALLLITVLALIFILNLPKKDNQNLTPTSDKTVFTPEFMSIEEKQRLELDTNSEIQVLKKDEAGQAEVYRIIKPGREVVNPDEIETFIETLD